MNHTQIEAAKRCWPEECALVTRDAQRVLDNTFLYDAPWDMEQTHTPVHFAGAIDWELCPAGDPEWTYMLARHGFVLHLAQAFALTGRGAYADKAFALMRDFMRRAPLTQAARATTWRSLDTGIRAVNWLQAWELLRAAGVPEGFEAELRAGVRAHADYLAGVDTPFCRLSNWGVIGNTGLYAAALFLGDEPLAAQAAQRLADEVSLQILPDGCQWEHSPMYHAEVLDALLKTVRFAKRAGRELPEGIARAAQRMCRACLLAARPDHHQFLQGDSDDTDVRGLITQGAVLFSDPVLKAGGYPHADFDTLFGASAAACEAYEMLACTPAEPAAFLAASGNCYLRTGWSAEDTCTHFFCGSMGGGHGHADLLHIDVAACGGSVLVDSGRYTYVESPERLWLKSCEAHNTVTVDGRPFTECTGTWTCGKKARHESVSMACDGDWMLAHGGHLGYCIGEQPVFVERTVLQLGKSVTFVADRAAGAGAHTFERFFHFAPGETKLVPGGALWHSGGAQAKLLHLSGESASLAQTMYSLHYNSLGQKPTLTLRSAADGAHFMPAVLVTGEGCGEASLCAVPVTSEKTGEAVPEALARAFVVRVPGAEDVTVLFADPEATQGVELLRAGGACGYGRVIVRQGARQSVLAW